MGGEVFLSRVTQGTQKSCQVQFMQHGDLKHMQVFFQEHQVQAESIFWKFNIVHSH